jgi:hypothetical protein
MRILDSGHTYVLDSLDGKRKNTLSFVKREGPGFPGNVGHHAGTNCQEVLRALIDRVKYLEWQIPHRNNETILNRLEQALWLFEDRAAKRHGRELRAEFAGIELLPTCPKCGHIECEAH